MRIKFITYSLCALAAVGATSCKDDLNMGVDDSTLRPEFDGPALYMTLGVNYNDVLAGTRSSTDSGKDDDYVSSTDGMEYSQLEEYDVRTAIIVLASMDQSEDYKYLAHADVNGILTSDRNVDLGDANTGKDIDPSEYYAFSTTGRFKYDQIKALYDDNGNIKDEYKNGVRVFVFCNPTGDLLNRFESTDFSVGTNGTDWVNWSGEVYQEPTLPGYTPSVTNSIWAPRSFLMSNARAAYADLPAKLENWDYYSSEKPYKLSGDNTKVVADDPNNSENQNNGKVRGPVYVERAVARVDLKADREHLKDLKDYQEGRIKEEDALWRYPILGGLSSSMHDGTIDQDGDQASSGFNFVDVQLTRVALVNMSNHYNFLRRVSENGLDANSTLMGVEYNFNGRANFVVDFDAARKQQEDGYNWDNATDGFNFALFTGKEAAPNPALSREFAYNANGWYSANIQDIMSNGKLDNTSGNQVNKYNIWRYITENTIPMDAAGGYSRQVAVQSTGLVFKGLLLPGYDVDEKFEYKETGIAAADEPDAMASDEVRYIPENVVNALMASKYHLPAKGSAQDGGKALWTPTPGQTKWEKDEALSDRSKERYCYVYPTLYMYQGSIYAGFADVVKAAQQYDGPGGLMYQAVNSTLVNYWARLEDMAGPSNDGTGQTEFKKLGADFNPNSEENSKYHWLQLNVEIYNKVVNKYGNDEPILKDIDKNWEATADNFKINIDEKDAAFRSMLTSGSDASRFTMYDASYEEEDRGGAGWGYYCFYFWWLKHNDNGVEGRMGPMEFATVRNNVYKISVDKISRIGHPLNNLNDPEPVIPETPDEDNKVFIDVTMKIVPWVVRKNSAQF